MITKSMGDIMVLYPINTNSFWTLFSLKEEASTIC